MLLIVLLVKIASSTNLGLAKVLMVISKAEGY
jgi:hypothetical protein